MDLSVGAERDVSQSPLANIWYCTSIMLGQPAPRRVHSPYEPLSINETVELNEADNATTTANRRSCRHPSQAQFPARRCPDPLLSVPDGAETSDLKQSEPHEVQVEPWRNNTAYRPLPQTAGPCGRPAGHATYFVLDMIVGEHAPGDS